MLLEVKEYRTITVLNKYKKNYLMQVKHHKNQNKLKKIVIRFVILTTKLFKVLRI